MAEYDKTAAMSSAIAEDRNASPCAEPGLAPVAGTEAALRAPPTTSRDALKCSSRGLLPWFLLGLLAIGLYCASMLLRPFVSTLIFAVVVAALLHPAYVFLRTTLRGREALSSLIVLFFVTILVILPLTLLIGGLISQMRYSVTAVTAWLSAGNLDNIFRQHLNPLFDWINEVAPFLGVTAESAKADIMNLARRTGQQLLGLSANLVGQTLTFGLHFLLFQLALFFFLKDGGAMVAHIKHLTPLREEQQERIIENLRRIAKSVLVGGFLVAALQGIAGGIGLAAVGIPPLFWGTVMAFTAFVPVVGPSMVWIPAVFVLLSHDEWKSALFLALWCSALVSSIDIFLRPFLMRDTSGVPTLFLFFAILGGIQAFGILGLLYGPLILAFAAVMLKIYADEYHDQLKSKSA